MPPDSFPQRRYQAETFADAHNCINWSSREKSIENKPVYWKLVETKLIHVPSTWKLKKVGNGYLYAWHTHTLETFRLNSRITSIIELSKSFQRVPHKRKNKSLVFPRKSVRHCKSRRLLSAPQPGRDDAELEPTSKRARTSARQSRRSPGIDAPRQMRRPDDGRAAASYKFVEVVRGRRARSTLLATECEQCKTVIIYNLKRPTREMLWTLMQFGLTPFSFLRAQQ